MQENDTNYFRRRAEIETERARKAHRPEVVAAHQQLASLYLERLGPGGTPGPVLHG